MRLAIALALLSSGILEHSMAQPLSDQALYRRCHIQITGLPLPFKNSISADIAAGKITGLQACENLLSRAEFGADGKLKNLNDNTARAILKNFQNFHRTWFQTGVVEDMQGYDTEISRGTTDIFDTTEQALAITRLLFHPGAKYSEVVTRGNGWSALRVEDPSVKARIGWTVTFPGRRIFGNNAGLNNNLFSFRDPQNRAFSGGANSVIVNLPVVQVGELIGIVGDTRAYTIPNFSLAPLGADRPATAQPGMNTQVDLFDSKGGGIIGLPSFFLLNYGHDLGTASNGATKVPRRWAQAAMQSLMCASLPALRESDIRKMVVGNSSTPFRNSASCVMCHATLDQMGYTARNLVTGASDYFTFDDKKQTLLVGNYHADMGEVNGWPSEPVANFHRTKPVGKLFYRSYTGALVDKSVVGIQGLGVAMSETDDLYTCAAKRYFEYFTGMDVPLFDRTDPNNSALNKKMVGEVLQARLFIEKLGQSLKSHQSLPQLVKEIMRSEYYRQVNFRVTSGN